MRRSPLAILLTATVAWPLSTAFPIDPVTPEVAELNFNTQLASPGGLAALGEPAWLTKVTQSGGVFADDPAAWNVAATAPKGNGRLEITIDRQRISADLVASILFDADNAADLAVQLFNDQGRVVVVDLFGNLVDVGKDLSTNTVVIPLRKYPTATKVVLRRIDGSVSVHGVVLYPVASEAEAVPEEMRKLAAALGDPLSPENPLSKGLKAIAKNAHDVIGPIVATIPTPAVASTTSIMDGKAASPTQRYYQGALIIPSLDTPAPVNGLMANWNFDGADAAADAGPLQLNGHGTYGVGKGVRGKALLLDSAKRQAVTIPHTPALDLKDNLTVSAWVKYTKLGANWGGQIVWYGDTHLGDDPWALHIRRDGQLEFRSDRTITGKPIFTVFDNEIRLSSSGKKVLDQHVSVVSPMLLQPETWYFVAGSMEKVSPQTRSMKLYVNGEAVAETLTNETVEYDTSKMWVEIGAVDAGTWQNFDGSIDEVRVYNRALTAAEVSALYGQVR